jgi:hypothetical protein
MITRQDMIKIAIIVGGVFDVEQRKSLAFSFANMLAESNPAFNRDKFLLACNVHVDPPKEKMADLDKWWYHL